MDAFTTLYSVPTTAAASSADESVLGSLPPVDTESTPKGTSTMCVIA
jgi:hypothetical protein